MTVSVVIPLLNEAESLAVLYERIDKVIQKLPYSVELLFVDDGSTDDSFAVLEKLQEPDPRIRAVQFRRNYGKSAALTVSPASAVTESIT